jgi:hypothetical protein
MHGRTRNALLALGFDTDLIARIDSHHHTVDALRSLSKPALRAAYTPEEVELIQDRIKRQPIPEETLERVIEQADAACCFCADGNNARPFQIHHAVEYACTQDNSEDNLILVCPTHHQNVPKHLSAEEQKVVRRKWRAVVEIARAYRERGLDFPFGLFVAMDYGLQPSPEELIDGYRLSNATALAATPQELAEEGVALLRERGLLPIVGASGDGKTTLAIGIAGHLWKEGFRVFKYQPPVAGRPLPLQDVLSFMQTADYECVLLLDDANRCFSETDLTQIGAAAGRPVLVLATWTRDRLSEDPRPERHLTVWLLVNWERIRPCVKAFLLAYEATVVAAIQRQQDPRQLGRVGLGYMDVPLARHIERYEREARSVSEFLFLLRGGAHAVQTEIEALADDSRSDIPALYAAIEQIAGFERFVTPEDTASACQRVSQERAFPAPTSDWVREVFRAQRMRGRMQETRGAYKTVHRDWAARLIGAALASARARPETERLLAPNIDLHADEPNRLMRLWSWLWHDQHGGPYIRDWLRRQQVADWTALVGKAVSAGLEEVGFVADRMHILFPRHDWEETVRAAFTTHEDLLALAVASAGPGDWISLRGLAFALGHACPDLAARLVERWDPSAAARIIESTHPDYYDTAGWVFASYDKHSPAWVKQVGRNTRWEAIADRLRQVRTGDLDAVFNCESLLLRLGIPLRRSMVKWFTKVITDAVRNAHLSDLHVGISFEHSFLWMLFPGDLQQVFESLSASRIAEDLGRSRPRHWRALADLTGLTWSVGEPFFAEVINLLDPVAFLDAVESGAVGHEHELRCLLWVLTEGDPKRRQLLASRMYPLVLAACKRSAVERITLLRAFRELDAELGARMLADACTDPAALEPDKEEQQEREDLTDRDEDIQQLREGIAVFEAANRDYIIDLHDRQLVELPEN